MDMKPKYTSLRSVRRGLAASATALCLLALTACNSDDSTIADELVSDIVIGDLVQGSTINVISYQGNLIQANPQVTTTYAESELTYEWYLVDNAAQPLQVWKEGDPITFDREHIASGRSLSYEVNLSPGSYTLIFEVSADNGYTAAKTATINAVTDYSQGFYILKETADGKTELDLLNTTGYTDLDEGRTAENVFIENVLTKMHGSPFPAQPQCLSTAINHCYIDTVTNTPQSANLVTVSTTDGQIYAMRNSDLRIVLTRDNLLFTDMQPDETPYRIVSGMWGCYLITNKGIRFQYDTAMGGQQGSGRYALESSMGASRWVVYDDASSGLFFWDEESHSIGVSDYNGTTTVAQDDHYKLSGLSRMNCVAAGFCGATQQVVFVLSSLDGSQRQIVQIASGFSGSLEVQAMRALRGNKVNTAHLFTVSCASAAFLYGVVENAIYGLDLTNYTEQEIKPKGMADDEEIIYISNQYGGMGNPYDYLVVGTRRGTDGYTLRFYKLLGGLPDGEPVYTLQGTGTPKAIHFTGQGQSGFFNIPLQD